MLMRLLTSRQNSFKTATADQTTNGEQLHSYHDELESERPYLHTDASAGSATPLDDPNTDNATSTSTLPTVKHASSSTIVSQSAESTLTDIASIMKDGFAQLKDDMKLFQEKLSTLEQTYLKDHPLPPGNSRRRNRRGGNKGKGKANQILDDWPQGPSGEKAVNEEEEAKTAEDQISNEDKAKSKLQKQSRFAEIPPETLNKVMKFAVQACRSQLDADENDHGWESSSEPSWNGQRKLKKEKTVLPKDESEIQSKHRLLQSQSSFAYSR